MKRKQACIALALCLCVAANLRVGCRVSVGGETVPGEYSRREVRECVGTASAAVEEISGGASRVISPEKRYFISLSLPDGDEMLLTDMLIRKSPGVETLDAVYVDGRRLGCVKSGGMLRYLLRRNIDAQMPNAAVSGDYSGDIEIKTEYCAIGSETAYEDMLLLVEGAAPVIYIDENGERA